MATKKKAGAPKNAATADSAVEVLRARTDALQTALGAFHTEVSGACTPTTVNTLFGNLSAAFEDVAVALNHKTGHVPAGALVIHPDWLKALGEPIPPKG